jgi:hypothetical protein
MKKLIFTLGIIAVSISLIFAQNIPNGGFEEWAIGDDQGWEPVNWETMNSNDFTNVYQVEGRTGESAALMKVEWEDAFQQYMTSMIFYKGNFPIDQRYTQISCWYKGSSIEGDSLTVTVSVWKGETMIGYGMGGTNLSADNWIELSVSIYYATEETPDNAFVALHIPPGDGLNYGTEFYVDDLLLKMGTGIFEANQSDPYQFTLFPNPASDIVNMAFNVPEKQRVSVEIIDVHGQLIKSLRTSETFEPGQHKITAGLNGFNPGIYYCRLTDEKGSVTMKKIVVM